MSRLNEISELYRMLKPGQMKSSCGPFGIAKYLLKFIQKCVKPTDTVIEIGTFRGISTELFAMHCEKVYTIDPYDTGNNVNQDGGLDIMKWAENELKERMRYHNNIEHIKLMSNIACKQFDKESIDIVYIDGDHRALSVYYDILNYLPLIKKTGILSGHDYNDNVKRVVNYMIGEPIEVFCESSWMFYREKIGRIRKLISGDIKDLDIEEGK